MASYSLEKDESTLEGLKYTARTSTEPLSAPLALLLVLVTASLFFLQRIYLAAVPALLLYRLFKAAHATEESLEIHPSIGLQLTSSTFLPYTLSLPSFISRRPPTTRSTIKGARIVRFAPTPNVERLVINEGLQGCGGKHYLAVVKSEGGKQKEVEVVFPTILPRLEDLQRVLSDAQPFLQ